jgi:outer membrane protein assembly factor BamB
MGFNSNVAVDIYFDSERETSIATNRSGQFDNAVIHVPREAKPGKHQITALADDNAERVYELFLVNTNWPQFHFSPDHSGFNPFENVLSPSTVSGIELKWTYAGGAFAASSEVADGYLYANTGISAIALNATDGSLRWILDNPGGPLPATGDGVVYVPVDIPDNSIDAVDTRTGAILWEFQAGYFVESPTLLDDVVYFGSGDYNVYALNAKTGALLWKYPTGGYVISAPAVSHRIVYAGSWDSNMYALDATTGNLLWKYTAGSYINSSPAISDGSLYFVAEDGKLYALNADTGLLRWTFTIGSNIFDQSSTPSIANDVVYVSSGEGSVYALDRNTGTLRWKSHPGYYIFGSSLAVANGVVYTDTDDGTAYALDASTGTTLWRGAAVIRSSPVVANGMLYIGGLAFGLPGH